MFKIAMAVVVSTLIALNAWAAESERVLFDFEQPLNDNQVEHLDSETQVIEINGDRALSVTLGADRPYPNVRLNPADGEAWDLNEYRAIEADITNLSDVSYKLGMRVDNKNANGRKNSNSGGVTVEPGATRTIRVDFDRKFAEELREQLKGMHYTPWGARGDKGGMIDPSEIVQLNFFVSRPDRSYRFAIDNVRAMGAFDPSTLTIPDPFFPFVDRFGQYIHGDWPGKVQTEADLKAAAEDEDAARNAAPRPAGWNRYGGWANGPQLEAKGDFYVARHNDVWWLVDPEGRLFFSIGMDAVRDGSSTPVTADRETWFRNKPWENEPDLREHFSTDRKVRRGDYRGQTPPAFNFYGANLERKYGENYRDIWLEMIPKRLMNWGFNTIANWSDDELFENTTIPYTDWVYINAPKLPWQRGTRNRISDPFNPLLEKELRRRAKNMIGDTVDDPYCIGYFVDNELSWGDERHLASGVIEKGKPKLPAKKEFFNRLEKQYGNIASFNQAWGTDYADWDAALEGSQLPKTEQGLADLEKFNEAIVETYFKTVRKVLKDIAPNKLYLGCRFAEYNPQVVRVAAKYCDVVSFNLYMDTVAGWRPPVDIDKPVIIGEFHFGASDRGVFGRGLRPADSTADRGKRFAAYLRSAAENPLVVGAHYFQLVDEPTSGRVGDGENHGVGFLAVTDTPHDAMLEASRRVATKIYDIRDSK